MPTDLESVTTPRGTECLRQAATATAARDLEVPHAAGAGIQALRDVDD